MVTWTEIEKSGATPSERSRLFYGVCVPLRLDFREVFCESKKLGAWRGMKNIEVKKRCDAS